MPFWTGGRSGSQASYRSGTDQMRRYYILQTVEGGFFLYIARCENEQNILKVPFRELIVNSVRRSSHAQICFATLPFWTGGRSGSQASSSTGLVEIKCIGDSVLHFMNGGESFYTLQDVKMNKIF